MINEFEEDEPRWNTEPNYEANREAAQRAVKRWDVVAVGNRPEDFIARDCLFGSLFHDHRARWFRNCVRKPPAWMTERVLNLHNQVAEQQALWMVALDYQHKLHLARQLPALHELAYMAVEAADIGQIVRRLWMCPPIGACVRPAGGGQVPPACGLPWLCPWCHARKIVKLYGALQQVCKSLSPDQYLVLSKAQVFGECWGGLNGAWEDEDQGEADGAVGFAGRRGRYFGRYSERVQFTRDTLLKRLLDRSKEFGIKDGLWTHQLTSFVKDRDRTFGHVPSLIGIMGIDEFERANEAGAWDDADFLDLPQSERYMKVLWVPMQADNPRALRLALVGGNVRVSDETIQVPSWWRRRHSASVWIPGALSWQPTFLFDDQIWTSYLHNVRKRHLYGAFGSWKPTLRAIHVEEHESISSKFGRLQAHRLSKRRQQAGNRKTQRNADSRRRALLTAAHPLWQEVLAEPHQGRGRPSYRAALDERLVAQGLKFSRRDLVWLMGQLRSTYRDRPRRR